MTKFNEIYQKIYAETEQDLEELRAEVAKGKVKRTIFQIIAIIVTIVAVYYCIKFEIEFETTIYVAVLGLGLITAKDSLTYSRDKKKYNSIFKRKVIKKIIKEYDKNLELIPDTGVSEITYLQSELGGYYTFSSENTISGVLSNGYKLDLAEVLTDVNIYNKYEKDVSTGFKGLFAKVNMKKNINGSIKVIKNDLKLNQIQEKLEMDSGEFEDIYNVYCDDKMFAMQVLTSDIIYRLTDFQKRIGVVTEFTIKENTLYIQFNIGSIFEGNIFKESLDYEVLNRFYLTLEFAFKITEDIINNILNTLP